MVLINHQQDFMFMHPTPCYLLHYNATTYQVIVIRLYRVNWYKYIPQDKPMFTCVSPL